MTLLFFEFIGTTELIVILVSALVLFGPRRLPELGRTIGRHLGDFKRASEDFKKTWESEVDMERLEREVRTERALLEDSSSSSTYTSGDATSDTTSSGTSNPYTSPSYGLYDPDSEAYNSQSTADNLQSTADNLQSAPPDSTVPAPSPIARSVTTASSTAGDSSPDDEHSALGSKKPSEPAVEHGVK